MYLQFLNNEPGNALICWLEFRPGFFEQYPISMLTAEQPFRFDEVTEQQFNICSQSTALLEQMQRVQAPTPFIVALQQTEITIHLLRRAFECIALPFTVCPVPACRFLSNDSEREKIMEACRVIGQTIDQPMTIKELSRKVAMNECYLKKGFKALTGKTIHEYQQELRISKAKQLLSEDGLSVSDVANSLGYSSISHFSTAFKKATGMKPCELLH
ncbi:MAG: AraC family transcriptional regulator [Sphingobacteriales bacterium]|nr:MAG: AraC family transcriptional regulator [Sphingobacteriales bacterium]